MAHVVVASLATLLALLALPCSAAEIDLDAVLRAKAMASDAAKMINGRNALCRKIGIWSKRDDCVALEIKNVRVRGGSLSYSEVKPAPTPETIAVETFLLRNCSSVARSEKKTVSFRYTEGSSVVTTDSIRSSSGVDAKISLAPVPVDLGFHGSSEVSFTKQESNHHQREVTENVTIDETVPPHSAILITVEKRISNAYLDFSGVIYPNADLYVQPCCGWSGNEQLLGTLESFVGEQSIPVRGQIWNATAKSTTKRYDQSPLNPNEPGQCPPALRPKGGSALTESQLRKLAPKDVQLLAMSGSNVDAKIVVSFVDGMTIRTGNSIANVEVRAKSMGPGACGVAFTVSGGGAQFLAPPAVFSPWTQLVSHIGSVDLTITNDVQCDTGIIAEIRYYP